MQQKTLSSLSLTHTHIPEPSNTSYLNYNTTITVANCSSLSVSRNLLAKSNPVCLLTIVAESTETKYLYERTRLVNIYPPSAPSLTGRGESPPPSPIPLSSENLMPVGQPADQSLSEGFCSRLTVPAPALWPPAQPQLPSQSPSPWPEHTDPAPSLTSSTHPPHAEHFTPPHPP